MEGQKVTFFVRLWNWGWYMGLVEGLSPRGGALTQNGIRRRPLYRGTGYGNFILKCALYAAGLLYYSRHSVCGHEAPNPDRD